MILKVGATGSTGNAYYIEHNGEILLLDAGINIKEIKQMIDFRVGDVVGCVLTHCHKDHDLSGDKLLNMGIRVFRPYELDTKILKTTIGSFRITSFPVPHDGVECRGYLIEIGGQKILYATDFEYIGYKFKAQKVNTMLIECNYQDDLVNDENDHRVHIFKGHAELNTVADFVAQNATDELRTVVLCHASQSGSLNKAHAVEVIKSNVPNTVEVHMAEKGLTIEI